MALNLAYFGPAIACFLVSLLLNYSCSNVQATPLPAPNVEVGPSPNVEKFLLQYGYAKPTKALLMAAGAETRNASAIEAAEMADYSESLRDYQAFVGLPVTGVADQATQEMMARPRCGVPDIKPNSGSGEETGNVRLMLSEATQKWSKTRLNYRIGQFSQKLSPDEQKRAIERAFAVWSKYSSLEFVSAQTSSGSADINIDFVRWYHNDPYPFDGPGRTLAHAFFPPDGKAHFDEDENWFYPENFDTMSEKDRLASRDKINLFMVAVHEFGHLIGLDHVRNNQKSIMAPTYNSDQHQLSLDAEDIKMIQALYGPPKPGPPTASTSSPPPSSSPKSTTSSYSTTTRGPIISTTTKKRTLPTRLPPRDGASKGTSNKCSERLLSSITAIIEGLGDDQQVIVFFGSKMRTFDRDGMSSEAELSSVFSPGPQSVTAALANKIMQVVLLFEGRKVWVYDFDGQTYRLLADMPKLLPENIPFSPNIVFQWIDGNQVLIKDNVFTTYDEAYNVRTFIGSTGDYFPNIPAKTKFAFNLRDRLYFYDGRFLLYITDKQTVELANDSLFQCSSSNAQDKNQQDKPVVMFLVSNASIISRISGGLQYLLYIITVITMSTSYGFWL